MALCSAVTPVSVDLPDLNALDYDALKALIIDKHAVILEQQAPQSFRAITRSKI